MYRFQWMACVALSGCGWLNDVPENHVPVREATQVNTRANTVERGGYAVDEARGRAMNSASEADRANGLEAAGARESDDGWNPISIPKAPPDRKFEFKAAGGTKIYNGRTTKGQSGWAKEYGMTEAEYERFQKEIPPGR